MQFKFIGQNLKHFSFGGDSVKMSGDVWGDHSTARWTAGVQNASKARALKSCQKCNNVNQSLCAQVTQ